MESDLKIIASRGTPTLNPNSLLIKKRIASKRANMCMAHSLRSDILRILPSCYLNHSLNFCYNQNNINIMTTQTVHFSNRTKKRTHLPAFLKKPMSAKAFEHSSQQKHSGCQLAFMALITRPTMNSSEIHIENWCLHVQLCVHEPDLLHFPQQGAYRTWKSCSQYFLPSNSK